jgi:long-chain acyl-CoA synthetase
MPMPAPTVAASTGAEAEIAAAETIPSLFWERVSRCGERVAFREKRLGIWQETTWAEFGRQVRTCAYGLMDLGVEPGDRVAILSEDRSEWFVTDLAILSVGAVTVGLYPSYGAAPCKHIVGEIEARVWIVENQEQFDKAMEIRHELPCLEWIVVIDAKGLRLIDDPIVLTFEQLLERGRQGEKARPQLLDERLCAIRPEDTATLIYSSGSTGRSKGIIHSHNSMIVGMRAAYYGAAYLGMDITAEDESIVYLPLGHVMERSMFVGYLLVGNIANFCESPETLFADLKEVAPTWLAGVPRVWEKLKAGVEIAVDDAAWLKRQVYRWGMLVGRRACRAELADRPVAWHTRLLRSLAEWIVLRKLRERVGLHRVEHAFSGAAPIASEVLEFLRALGVPIREAYGQTETGLFVFTPVDGIRPGKAGVPIPGVEYRVDGNGEILWRTPGMALGYFKNPTATEAAFVDGFFRSGDLGTFDDDGYLQITGRAADSFNTAGGRLVAPQNIENMLKASDYIMDAVVVGEAKPHLTALIVLDEETASHYAQTHGVPYSSFADLSRRPEIVRLIEGEVRKVNERWSDREQIIDFRILKWELSRDEEELTPTMKVRRKYLCQQYNDLIEEMYSRG